MGWIVQIGTLVRKLRILGQMEKGIKNDLQKMIC